MKQYKQIVLGCVMNKKIFSLLLLMFFVALAVVVAAERHPYFDDYNAYAGYDTFNGKCIETRKEFLRELHNIECEYFKYIPFPAGYGIKVNANEYLEFIMAHSELYSEGLIGSVILSAERDEYMWIYNFSLNLFPPNNTFENYREIMLRHYHSEPRRETARRLEEREARREELARQQESRYDNNTMLEQHKCNDYAYNEEGIIAHYQRPMLPLP